MRILMVLGVIALACLAFCQDDFERMHCLITYRGHYEGSSVFQHGSTATAEQLIDYYKQHGKGEPIVIFIHGGLVGQNAGLDDARTLQKLAFSENCYPIYFIWNGGPETAAVGTRHPGGALAGEGSAQIQSESFEPLSKSPTVQNFERVTRAIGEDLWDSMKTDMETAFRPGNPGYNFIRALSTAGAPRIILVGHSAGCIYQLLFMDAARTLYPKAQFDVVMMAPACSYVFLSQELANWRSEGYQPFRSFRMFALTDRAELDDHVLDTIGQLKGAIGRWQNEAFPASLLYYVCRDCEKYKNTPILGMNYYARDYPNVDSLDEAQHLLVRQMLTGRPDSVVWSGYDTDDPTERRTIGFQCGAKTHGDFIEDSGTTKSLAAIVADAAADPDPNSDWLHVEPGLAKSGFSSWSQPERHVKVSAQKGGLHFDLDDATVYSNPTDGALSKAIIALEGPVDWASTPTKLSGVLHLRFQKTTQSEIDVAITGPGVAAATSYDTDVERNDLEDDIPGVQPGSAGGDEDTSLPFDVEVQNGRFSITISVAAMGANPAAWAVATLDSVDVKPAAGAQELAATGTVSRLTGLYGAEFGLPVPSAREAVQVMLPFPSPSACTDRFWYSS